MIVIIAIVSVLFVLVLVFITIYELIGVYRNPFPMFHNSDKRLSEIYEDKTKKYSLHSIIENAKPIDG